MMAGVLVLVVGTALVAAAVLAHRLRGARVAAAATGLLSVVGASVLIATSGAEPAPGPVTVTIVDELGPGQISETVRVFFDGRDAGVLSVDGRKRTAALKATLPRAGRYEYTTQARRRLKGKAPGRASFSKVIEIDGDTTLAIYYDDADRTYLKP